MELKPGSKLIENLRKKKELLQKKDPAHEQIRTLLLIPGGGMRGAYGMGSAIALHMLGFDEVFDNVVGISTGAGVGAALLAKQAAIGSSVYYNDLTKNNFIKFSRYKKILDLEYLVEVLQTNNKKLNIERINNSRSNLYFGVTRYEDSVGEFIDAKRAQPDLLTAMKASMAPPGLYNLPVVVNGTRYVDGGVAMPLPIEEVIKQFAPTDVLVISNNPSNEVTKERLELFVKKIISLVFFRQLPAPLKELLDSSSPNSREQRHKRGLSFLATLSDINVGVLWPPDTGLSWLSSDPQELQRAVTASLEKTLTVFGEPEKLLGFEIISKDPRTP